MVGDTLLTSPQDVSEAFNSHFCTIGAKLESELPTSPVDPLSYMSSVAVTESFSLNPVTPSECCKIISSLKNTKQDFNFISVKVIKVFKNYISAIFPIL